MGAPVETLADLIPEVPRAICVGVNPAPVSVEAGHYYQGRLGQRFFSRLDRAGVFHASAGIFEDDAAFGEGIGFTDVVKRPTARANELAPAELRHGRDVLEETLSQLPATALICPFKTAATALLGDFDGSGWLQPTFANHRVFVMPGPYERRELVDAVLAMLLPGL